MRGATMCWCVVAPDGGARRTAAPIRGYPCARAGPDRPFGTGGRIAFGIHNFTRMSRHMKGQMFLFARPLPAPAMEAELAELLGECANTACRHCAHPRPMAPRLLAGSLPRLGESQGGRAALVDCHVQIWQQAALSIHSASARRGCCHRAPSCHRDAARHPGLNLLKGRSAIGILHMRCTTRFAAAAAPAATWRGAAVDHCRNRACPQVAVASGAAGNPLQPDLMAGASHVSCTDARWTRC